MDSQTTQNDATQEAKPRRRGGSANFKTAPPITHENAREYARRSALARNRKRKLEAQGLQMLLKPEYAQACVAAQINRLIFGMDKEPVKSTAFARMVGLLDKLWPKVFAAQAPNMRLKPKPKAPPQPALLPYEQPEPEAEPSPKPVVLGDDWQQATPQDIVSGP